jgi:alanine dehydrogenase
MTLILSNEDVRASVTMGDAVEAMEAAFREQGAGGVNQPPRTNIKAGKGWLRVGPVVMEHSGWMGFKAMNLAAGIGVRYQVHLYSIEDGDLKAIMDAQYLTTLRTGATSAVATKRLARKTPGKVAVLGSGVESRAQLEAMHEIGLVESATVYSPTRENRDRFAAEYTESLGVEVQAMGSAEEAVTGCAMVVAGVKSQETVLHGSWLTPGMHVNSVGTARRDQREIDPETFERAAIIVVDSRDGVFGEAGDAVAAKDVVSPDQVHELAELVSNGGPNRSTEDQITLFKSVGTGVQDIGLAAMVYERARAGGYGTEFADFPFVKRS